SPANWRRQYKEYIVGYTILDAFVLRQICQNDGGDRFCSCLFYVSGFLSELVALLRTGGSPNQRSRAGSRLRGNDNSGK
ncbi:MAG: hypothetical protein V1719_02695, partial [Patescibacteria group bacterium]